MWERPDVKDHLLCESICREFQNKQITEDYSAERRGKSGEWVYRGVENAFLSGVMEMSGISMMVSEDH